MFLVRQLDGGPLQFWEIAPDCVQWPEITRSAPTTVRHKARTWRFGAPLKRDPNDIACGEHYPMLTGVGSAAIAETMVEALDLLTGE